MSLDAAKRRIRCDNRHCGQDVMLPIQIDRASDHGLATSGSSAAGWVFVVGPVEDQHYCPACAPSILGRSR